MKIKQSKKIIFFFIVDQNCHSDMYLRWRTARAAHYLINFAI